MKMGIVIDGHRSNVEYHRSSGAKHAALALMVHSIEYYGVRSSRLLVVSFLAARGVSMC